MGCISSSSEPTKTIQVKPKITQSTSYQDDIKDRMTAYTIAQSKIKKDKEETKRLHSEFKNTYNTSKHLTNNCIKYNNENKIYLLRKQLSIENARIIKQQIMRQEKIKYKQDKKKKKTKKNKPLPFNHILNPKEEIKFIYWFNNL